MLFTDTVELTLLAGYSSREQKLSAIQKASAKLDTLKFFLQLAWAMKVIDHKKYAAVSVPLGEVGKMFGGWLKQLTKQTPPNHVGGE